MLPFNRIVEGLWRSGEKTVAELNAGPSNTVGLQVAPIS